MRLPRLTKASIATQVLVLQTVLIACLVAAGSTAAFLQARSDEHDSAERQVLAMAESFAAAPGTAQALEAPDPTTRLQPLTQALQRQADVDFIVVMSPAGIRYTHPNPALIGQKFIGHIQQAQLGHPFAETYTGTLGPSVRSVVPVRDASGRIVGLVSIGITVQQIGMLMSRQLPAILGLSALALALAAIGAYVVGQRVRRQTMGLGPVHLAELYEHHEAVMHAMREGLLLFDPQRRLLLANDEAVRLLDLPEDRVGRRLAELPVTGSLSEALADGHDVADEIHLTEHRVLAVNQSTAVMHGRAVGTVVTLRDRTELHALTDELDSVRGFAEVLRSSNHEAANRLHTVVTLIELGRQEDAVRFATTELAAQQELIDRLMAEVDEPVLAALLLGKVAQAGERGIELVIDDSTRLCGLPVAVTDAVTLIGNLVDNALDAVAAESAGKSEDAGCAAGRPPRVKRVNVELIADDNRLRLAVSDTGPGVPTAEAAQLFVRGYSTKPGPGRGLGLALVDQIVRRHGGRVQVSSPDGGGALFKVLIP